jgi:hypothetical protein
LGRDYDKKPKTDPKVQKLSMEKLSVEDSKLREKFVAEQQQQQVKTTKSISNQTFVNVSSKQLIEKNRFKTLNEIFDVLLIAQEYMSIMSEQQLPRVDHSQPSQSSPTISSNVTNENDQEYLNHTPQQANNSETDAVNMTAAIQNNILIPSDEIAELLNPSHLGSAIKQVFSYYKYKPIQRQDFVPKANEILSKVSLTGMVNPVQIISAGYERGHRARLESYSSLVIE